MSEAWQSAWVEILPDFKNFKNTANKEMSNTLGAAGTAGGVVAGKNMGSGLLGGIKGIGGPLIAAVAALGIGRLIGEAIGTSISYGLDAIGLASDLNESFNAVEVTFGKEVAAELKLISDAAPETLRVSRKTFNEYATRFSSFGKTIVGEGGDVVKFMDELTTRGADFASVYNVEVGDALQLFQSGLAGETEPLRKYGIDLSAASVSAYAYANGIGEAGKELTEAQKIQARYASLLDQTSKVQGDATNTSGDLAAQQRDLKVAFEEVQTSMGQALLPGFLDLVTFANDSVVPAFSDMIEKVGPVFGQALEDSAPKIEALVEKLVPMVEAFAEAAAEDGIPAFIDTLDQIAEEAPGWIDAFNTVDSAVREATDSFIEFSKPPNDKPLIDYLFEFLRNITQFSVDLGIGLARATVEFTSVIGDVQTNIGNAGEGFRTAGRDLIKKFAQGITAGIAFVAPAVTSVMDFVAGFFPHSPAERGPFSGAGWTAVGTAGKALADEFASGFNSRPALQVGAIGSGISGAALSGIQPSGAAFANNASPAQITQHITLVDQDPRLVARQMANEFKRELAG